MPSAYGETLSILVVEDDEAVAGLLRAILNDVPGWGATVVHDAAAERFLSFVRCPPISRHRSRRAA